MEEYGGGLARDKKGESEDAENVEGVLAVGSSCSATGFGEVTEDDKEGKGAAAVDSEEKRGFRRWVVTMLYRVSGIGVAAGAAGGSAAYVHIWTWISVGRREK